VENTVEPDRPQMTTKHMRTANWIPMAKNTHLEYAIFLLFHSNNCCTNAPKCYVIRTVPIFLCVLTHYLIINYNYLALL